MDTFAAEPAFPSPLLPKDWWRSRTILGAVAVIAAQALRGTGFEIGDAELTDVFVQLATLGGALIAIVGRLKATRPVRSPLAGKDAQAALMIAGGCLTALLLDSCSTPAGNLQGSVRLGYQGNTLKVSGDGKTTSVDLDLPDLGGLAK